MSVITGCPACAGHDRLKKISGRDDHGPRCGGDGRYARHRRRDRQGAEGGRLHGRGELRRQRRGRAEVQGGDRHRRLQVGRLLVRRLRGRHQAGRGRARADRRAGQQCRHHPRRAAAPHEARAMDGGDQHQSQFAVQHVPQRDRGHARAQVRPHRQYLLDQRPEGPVRPDAITPPPRPASSASPRRWRRRARARASPSTPSARATSTPRWCRRCRRTCWKRASCR